MPVKIIAEAGTNHNGDFNTALKLVDVAQDAQADFIKFQIIDPDSLYVPFYWENGERVENIVHTRRKKESLSYDEWERVSEYANKKGISFSASVFDAKGVDFLKRIKAPFVKLASSDLNNIQLIEYIAKAAMPAIISTGMATLKEIKESVDTYLEYGNLGDLSVLHCVSVYPCTLDKTRLFQIDELKRELSCEIGFSDHTMNSTAACVALTKDISFIEKHFTIDKNLDGFDHKYASNPSEFREYVKDIRDVESTLAMNDIKTGEEITKVRARRGLYLNRELKKGSVIKNTDIVALRPVNKLQPNDFSFLVGKVVGENLSEYHALKVYDDKVYLDENFDWRKAGEFWKNEMKEKKML